MAAAPLELEVGSVKECTCSRRAFTRQSWLALVGVATAAAPAVARAGSLFHTRIVISSQGLDVQGEVYRKSIPISDLRLSLARVVDLDREPALRPGVKLYGAGLPSYKSGWYRLKNRDKALVAVARSNLAVYIPTSQGYSLLFGPDQPAELLAAIQNRPAGVQVFLIENAR